MLQDWVVSRKVILFFAGIKGYSHWKIEREDFFVVRQIEKIFLRKTVLRRTGKGSSFLSPWQKTGGGKCWVFVVLTRLKNSFKSHFFTWSMNCFIVLRAREQSTSQVFTSFPTKRRVDLTGDNRQLEGLYPVHTSLRRFFVSVRFYVWRMVLALARCTKYVQIGDSITSKAASPYQICWSVKRWRSPVSPVKQ